MNTRSRSKQPKRHRQTGPARSAAGAIYGVHAVLAALANPARDNGRLLITRNAMDRHGPLAFANPVPVEIVPPRQINDMLPDDAVHQGLLLETAPLPEPGIEEVAHDGLMIVLDQVSDPHNVGAILRSAAAFVAHAVISTARHSPPQSAVLAKAASGALEHVCLVRVGNLARALDQLADAGVTTAGLDSGAAVSIEQIATARPLALVLGAEGQGLRRLTKERCQVLTRIDAPGEMPSLNVSNAAAIALYAVSRSNNATIQE